MSSSAITKSALCDSLKKLCEQKPFDKISISDITGECGLNRQSFYYHFQDKYELLSYKRFYSNTLKSNEKIFEHYLFRSMHKLFIRFFYHAVAITRKRSDKAKFFADFYSHGYCGIIIDWATGGMRETPHDVMLKMRELAYENVTIGEGFRQNL